MRDITVKGNQTLLDISLQEYGSYEAVSWLVEDNVNLKGITDSIFEGDLLKIRDSIFATPMKNYLCDFELNTADQARGEGVGFWRIGINFKVS